MDDPASPPLSPPPSPPQPIPTPTTPPAADKNRVRSVFEWRRNMMSILVVIMATAMWVVLKVYNFNFIPVASYVGMAISASLYIWAFLLRLIGKETPRLTRIEISEQRAAEMGNTVKELMEEGIRWMFQVGAEGDIYIFGGSVAVLWILSYIGTFIDLLTFLYMGTLVEVIVLPICKKYEYEIKEYRNRVNVQCHRFYNILNEWVVKNIVIGDKKEKKVE